jgi:translation initiation factor 5B
MECKYRSPICSVLGHVDVGKTLFLDRLRNTSVQIYEPGGITQKVGITYLKNDTLQHLIGATKNGAKFEVPGIMFVDTPGHECFTSQRMTGIEISDLVIIIVDIFKGLEQQTIESLNLLRKSNTPCVIVANKVDRINNWKSIDGQNIIESYKSQSDMTKRYLDDYINNIISQCAEQNLNAAVYYKNKNYREFVSIIPFSAKTGEGMPDLLMMISILCMKYLRTRLSISNETTTGFLIEKMVHKSYGSIITTVLTDGHIKSGDTMIFRDSYGLTIDAKVRRIYQTNEKVEIKDRFVLDQITEITDPTSFVLNLDYDGDILTGTRFYVYSTIEDKERFYAELSLTEGKIRKSDRLEYAYSKNGVYLVAPTIGMLDALYNICSSRHISISGTDIGFISKKTIIRATHNFEKNRLVSTEEDLYNQRFCVILGYGLDISHDILSHAKQNHVQIITNDVIYRLLDEYELFCSKLNQKIRDINPGLHLPFRAAILPQYIFRTDKPILIGVKILSGTLYVGQSILAVKDDISIRIGIIRGIQNNKDNIEFAKEGMEVCMKIDNSDTQSRYGKDFNETYELVPYYTSDEKYFISNYPEIFE